MKISIDPRTRHTLRGLKRCPSCGEINGQRALLCRNESCELRLKTLANRRPFDPVALVVSASSNRLLYSLRSKERDAQPRNFVTITEVTLALEEPNSEIVSRNAICYVDTCKYDACDATDISCKHIRACTTIDANKASIPQAEVYKVAREVLWNLNIDAEQKLKLWNTCVESEHEALAVQRLNASTFAVKCAKSKLFPAGWLHVTVTSNTTPPTSARKLSQAYGCACKKLKIIVESDNSVVMKEEICDHLLLVLAAVLSKPNGKATYQHFTSALKSFWMPAALETPVLYASQEDDSFFASLNINIAANMCGDDEQQHAADDIFIFKDEFLRDDIIPDFSDIVLNLSPTNTSSTTSQQTTTSMYPPHCTDLMHPGDPNLVSSCAEDEDVDIRFADVVTTTSTVEETQSAFTGTHLELSDCNIELMDQFHQLTDQIDLCSDDITLPVESAPELLDISNISILTSPLQCNKSTSPAPKMPKITTSGTNNIRAGCSLLKSAQLLPAVTAVNSGSGTLPTIELPTIAMVKSPLKVSDIVTEVRTRKFPHIPAKRALIVNATHGNVDGVAKQAKLEVTTPGTEPALAYSAWLEHIIEMLNESITVTEQTNVLHSFHVHEEMFSHFSKSFSVGTKWRLPNTTTVVKSGKLKGLIKYTWYFTHASTVRRIFSTKNFTLELERKFERNSDGDFVPYVQQQPPQPVTANINGKLRRIYPKLALYIAHIWFQSGDNAHKTGVKLEWLPNAFPKSHFGILNIEFSLGIRNPHQQL